MTLMAWPMELSSRSGRSARAAALVPSSAAEVWDVAAAPGRAKQGDHVRTLQPRNRTYELARTSLAAPAEGGDEGVELGRERSAERNGSSEGKDNLVLGLLMSAALLLGSALGGAFSESGIVTGSGHPAEAASVQLPKGADQHAY